MHIDMYIALAGLIVGFAVGLTGMGGGALMTPVLVLIFGVQPLAAVSSDLVASLLMKPLGALVHAGKRTVNWSLVRWLSLGSVPGALLGVTFLKMLGKGAAVQNVVQLALGSVLLLSVSALTARWLYDRRRRAQRVDVAPEGSPIQVRRLAHHADRPGRGVHRRDHRDRVRHAHHRGPAAHLPAAAWFADGGNRPHPGDPAGGCGRPRTHPLRRLPPGPDRLHRRGCGARGPGRRDGVARAAAPG